jgi:outer membrane protein assembly factor BamB
MTTGRRTFGSSIRAAIDLMGPADSYFLSDGSSWRSGAGSHFRGSAALDRIEVEGTTVRYHFLPPSDGLLYRQTDYDVGDHSAQGSLGPASPLVLEATLGSSTAVMRGRAAILTNDATWYGEPRFNYYSAPVGTLVPFVITYRLESTGGWTEDVFTRPMTYTTGGKVSFVTGVTLPPLADLTISGPPQVAGVSTFQYYAIARYENGALRHVTDAAAWTVEPAAHASIEAGVLATRPLSTTREDLVVRATYAEGDVVRHAEKAVVYRVALDDPSATEWPMFQANAKHTGHVPLSLDAADFELLWRTPISASLALNPLTVAEGRVFGSLSGTFRRDASVFVLDAADGSMSWSKTFTGAVITGGAVYSVNPPSFGYGNVYVQTCDNALDTWLHAFDAVTGEPVFRSLHGAQWERYYAPTLRDGKVYVNGGDYGGAYGFDALTGVQLWFQDLPQFDQWTPAVDEERVYAYVGTYSPGLYVMRRDTGQLEFMIPDPGFEWNGWSMNLAPVLGARDVLAIHDGRLLAFDPTSRTIRWQIESAFQGQPTLAHGTIYAIDGGAVVARDEATGALLWSWHPPAGGLTGTLVATDTHLFASTQSAVHAIDLASRQSVWSYPASGHLALGNGALYVAGRDGAVTAIQVVRPNRPPDVSAAVAIVEEPWPPNHRMVPVGIGGVVDPDGDAVEVRVTGVTQDEPVDGNGDGSTCPDATIDGAGHAAIRIERAGPGNGRVYAISFVATDPDGASSSERVTVCVAHDQGHPACVDDGPTHDATRACAGAEPTAEEIRDLGMRIAASGRDLVLELALPRAGPVDLAVFDVAGRRVATVVHGVLPAGRHRAAWTGAGHSAGVYFLRLRAESAELARPITIR